MAPDLPTDERDAATTPGASAAAPAGTNAVAVYSDPRCPWAYVGIRRLLAAIEEHGVESELHIDHRWFPLDEDATPGDGEVLDRKLAPIRALLPDARWHEWSTSDHPFPASSTTAAAWVQAAKRQSPAASVALDRALRDALFLHGRDIGSETEVEEIAATVPDLDIDAVRAEVASGRADAELERHATLAASDLVPASPTVVLTDGTSWTNPGIEFHDDDGVPVIERDEPEVHGRIIEAFLALRHYD